MNTNQKGLCAFTFIWITIFGLFIYQFFFHEQLKANSVVTEIESLKIDSTNSFQYSFEPNLTYLEFWVGGKYKISVTTTDPKPFYSTARQEVIVKDIDGDFVLSYDTKYHYSTFDCWESDYKRLMRHLNIQHK